jgi:predicted secreted protein
MEIQTFLAKHLKTILRSQPGNSSTLFKNGVACTGSLRMIKNLRLMICYNNKTEVILKICACFCIDIPQCFTYMRYTYTGNDKGASMTNKSMVSFLILLALISASQTGATETSRSGELNYNLIDFSVQARREVANDLMQAVMFIEAVGSSPAELADGVNKRFAAAMAKAKSVEAVKVESGNYRTWANYQKEKQDGWRTRAELRLESRDFDALAKLIGNLQAADVQLATMEFSISPSLRSRIEEELTREALSAFQGRADMIRQSLKAQTLKIVTIHLDTQTPQPPRPLYRAKAMSAMSEAAPPPVEAGTSGILVSATGTVQVQ